MVEPGALLDRQTRIQHGLLVKGLAAVGTHGGLQFLFQCRHFLLQTSHAPPRKESPTISSSFCRYVVSNRCPSLALSFINERSLLTPFLVSLCQQNKPQGVITDGVTLSGPGWCEDAGVYEFTMGADGSKVMARYSFVYVQEDGEWKIAHHHSSAMPEGLLAASAKIKQLENFFDRS